MRKILTILCLFSALSLAAFGQGSYVPPQTALKSVNGVTVPFAGATITVCAAATGGVPCSPALANAVFSNAALTQPLSNPFTADANGNYQFAIAAGTYTVTVSGTGFTGYSYQVSVVASSGSGSSGLSNLVSGQVPIANSATTANSSKAIQGTDANLLSSGAVSGAAGVAFCTDGNGGATTSGCAATAVTFNNVGAGTNTVPLVEGTGGSISPSGLGQIAGSQGWMIPGIATVTPTATLTGGSIGSGHAVLWAYTLNSAAGETLPSDTTTNSMGSLSGGVCNSGALCTTSILPTVPANYSGYTAYFCDTSSGSGCTAPVKVLACINITTICTVTNPSLNSGVALPTTNSAWVQPTNTQSTLCASSILPSQFTTKADGNSYSFAGVDFSNGSPLPSPNGTFVACDRLFITDSKQTIADASQTNGGLIRNALFSVGHLSGSSTSTGSTTDDRVIAYRGTDSLTSPTYEQWLGVYGEHFVYNNNFSCSPIGGSSVGGEDCMAALRVRSNDQRTAAVNTITVVGVHGHATTNVSAPKVGGATPAVIGVVGSAGQETVTTQNGNASVYAGVLGVINASGGNTNGSGWALVANLGATRFATQNAGLFVASAFSGANAGDYSIRSDATAKSTFQGSLFIGASPAIGSAMSSLNVTGSFVNTGSLGTTQFATPTFANGNVVNIGAAGAVTYTYKVVAKDGNGNTTAASGAGTTTTGNATLDGTNFNRITVNFCNGLSGTSANGNGWSAVDVYRTASGGVPATTGKIGTITPTYFGNSGSLTTCNQVLDDKGLAGDSSTAPTVNSTAAAQVYKTQTLTNCAAVGTSASPSVASCAAASAGLFSCATNASGATCTVNTTAVTANSVISITPSAADGTPLGVTCNTTADTPTAPRLAAKVAGVSFTINLGTVAANPTCYEYTITN